MIMQKIGQGRGLENLFDGGTEVRQERLKNLKQVLIIMAMLALTTVLNILLEKIIQPSSLVFVYLVPTIASAIFFGIWAAVFSFTGGFLIFDFLFVEPHYSLYISKPQDVYNITVYFIIAALITYLINIVRHQNAFLKDRLDRVSLIEDMSRDFLLITPVEQPFPDQNFPESLRTRVVSQLGQLFLKYVKMILDVPVLVFFREQDGSLKIWAKSSIDLEITENERNAAVWTLKNGEVSGAGTHTHSATPYFFIPMTAHEEIIGVLGILYDSKDLFPEQRRLLGTISNLTTIVAARWMSLKSERG
jgi:two-component system sensor histidine kinase KdpD